MTTKTKKTKTTLKIQPLHSFILLDLIEGADISAGGIHLPNSAQEKPPEGTVLAVGPGRILNHGEVEPINVNVGDRVLFSRGRGTMIMVSNTTDQYLLIDFKNILAILS